MDRETADQRAVGQAAGKARPLDQLVVVITRAEQQAGKLAGLLAERGAVPIFYPCLAMQPPTDLAPLDAALQKAVAGAYEWLIFTSTNTVEMVAQRLQTLNMPPDRLHGVKVAAVGPATAESIGTRLGLTVHVVPDEYVAESLVAALDVGQGVRILLPQSAIARSDLADCLAQAGAQVTGVVAYRTVLATGGEDVPGMLWEGKIDVVTFTSASTVRYFRKRVDRVGGSLAMLQDVCVACIGPITAQTARDQGLRVNIVPAAHTTEGLVHALEDHFAQAAR